MAHHLLGSFTLKTLPQTLSFKSLQKPQSLFILRQGEAKGLDLRKGRVGLRNSCIGTKTFFKVHSIVNRGHDHLGGGDGEENKHLDRQGSHLDRGLQGTKAEGPKHHHHRPGHKSRRHGDDHGLKIKVDIDLEEEQIINSLTYNEDSEEQLIED